MNLLKPGDYGVFVDGDTQFLTYKYGNQLYDVTDRYPSIGVFTCYTNRVDCKWQILPNVDKDSNDILYHRTLAQIQEDSYYCKIKDITNLSSMSGVFMMIKKEFYDEMGSFPEEGMLGIDNHLHKRVKELNQKAYLIEGLYIYHYYRNNNREGHKHLLK